MVVVVVVGGEGETWTGQTLLCAALVAGNWGGGGTGRSPCGPEGQMVPRPRGLGTVLQSRHSFALKTTRSQLQVLKNMTTSTKPTKKLLNRVEDCVDESVAGYTALHAGVRRLASAPRVVVRTDLARHKALGRVAVLSGGGSGHEPAFTGERDCCLGDDETNCNFARIQFHSLPKSVYDK